MRYLLLLAACVALAACNGPAPTGTTPPQGDVMRTAFPDTLTTEQIYLGDTLLPVGTRFIKQQLPSGQRLEIQLPAGVEVAVRKTSGAIDRANTICYACECFGEKGTCEVALYNVQGGQLGFLQGSCDAEVIGWYCDED